MSSTGNNTTSLRYSRSYSSSLSKQRRSGYEPSDTETDWQDSPRANCNQNHNNLPKIHLDLPVRNAWELDDSSPNTRKHTSKSPYNVRKEDGRTISPMSVRRNVSPFSKSEHRRQVSSFKFSRNEKEDEIIGFSRRKNQRTPNSSFSKYGEVSRANERSSHIRRSATAPKQRTKEILEKENNLSQREQKGDRTPSPMSTNKHRKETSVGEINEFVANIKMSRSPVFNAESFESTDSISPGDIFFSRDHTALPKNTYPMDSSSINQVNNPSKTSIYSGSRTTAAVLTSSALSGQSSGKFSTESSKVSDTSRTTTASMKRFTENRKKSQADVWFSCMRRGPCRTRGSPEKQRFDEASFIEKAFVVERLRPFWADKHQPTSLNGFICRKQEAQLLKQHVDHDNIPHILLKGPPGSGKRSLAMALLCEIFGDTCRNKTHDLRYFQVQEQRGKQVAVPITSSGHHVELNVNLEPNAKYALMSLVKEISNNFALAPEVSKATFRPDYKVLVLYQVDKASENIQHLIKWIMDCYTDACKLVLCCEDDADILESVTNRCKIVKVDSPVTHEIMEVLIQIARKEEFDLPMNFAARIAAKSKQNLRKAIMTLEACKAHNYPFSEDQPIPSGWEEVLIELAAEILADPSHNRVFLVRGKFQKLLVDFVHPKLILLKLMEQFLKGVDSSSRRELYYWHAYYDKRMPTGSSALLKLEEFVAKFMSLHRKNSGSRQYE